ncbi:MAG TPA: flagellar hook-basal body complex protein FliE [Bryobacteraceae bacterium]|nr:flagellar hook-basal body complex protein FliE [Bryobacteraceae bacterium]
MAAPILPVNLNIPMPSAAPVSPPAAGPAPAGAGSAFQSVFNEAISTVERFGQDAQASVGRFLSGEGEELHQVAIKTQEAELTFDLFLQVRNKVISAYQEVMKMQV